MNEKHLDKAGIKGNSSGIEQERRFSSWLEVRRWTVSDQKGPEWRGTSR